MEQQAKIKVLDKEPWDLYRKVCEAVQLREATLNYNNEYLLPALYLPLLREGTQGEQVKDNCTALALRPWPYIGHCFIPGRRHIEWSQNAEGK